MPPLTAVPIVRIREGARLEDTDVAAIESPLELRIHGEPFTVMMRTPGADRELVAGFLLAERIIRSADELGTIGYCADRVSEPHLSGDVVNVLMDEAHADHVLGRLAARRHVLTGSSCGLCGRATLEAMEAGLVPLETATHIDASLIATLPDRLRSRQPMFDSTGGMHAAGVFDRHGNALAVAEDVGRHNAVDKVVGSLLLGERLPLSDAVLCVSGRTSYDILQKAWCAGIPIVAAVSAPSSLAVELADKAAIALAGFVRGGGLNVYTRPERIIV
jgi:FdhD protein